MFWVGEGPDRAVTLGSPTVAHESFMSRRNKLRTGTMISAEWPTKPSAETNPTSPTPPVELADRARVR